MGDSIVYSQVDIGTYIKIILQRLEYILEDL